MYPLFNIFQSHLALLVILFVWSIIWKGLALWKSAKRDHKIWFVVFMIINTVGILEILYLYVFSKLKKTQKNF